MPSFRYSHPSGFSISSELTKADIELAIPELSPRDMETGWILYDLKPAELDNQCVTFSIAFFDDLVRKITITVQDEPKDGSNWNQWSEADEHKSAEDAGAWLQSLGYQAGNYDWGTVWWGYDAKSGFGSAIISYKAG